jgi:hypothetical protein
VRGYVIVWGRGRVIHSNMQLPLSSFVSVYATFASLKYVGEVTKFVVGGCEGCLNADTETTYAHDQERPL